MPKSFQQKMKILYLMQLFLEKTDEQHPVSVKDMLIYLEEFGIHAERKSVYDDIEALRLFGMDIENRRERPSGFYLASREFELAELKLLISAVEASKSISSGKSRLLIQKLAALAGCWQGKELQQVQWEAQTKTVNESIFYNIDSIHTAISQKLQISFQYYEWAADRKLHLKRDGQRYRVSPWYLLWKNENYYLLGLDEKSGMVKHYRVDKMLKISVEKEGRNGEEIFRDFNISRFAAGTFGMFGGREESIRLEFETRLAGIVLDHFGADTMLIGRDAEHFSAVVHVNVSAPFFGWLAGLGSGMSIMSPDSVKKEYYTFLKTALENCGEQNHDSKIQTSGIVGAEQGKGSFR